MNAAGAVRNDHRRAQYDGISPLGRAVAQLCLGEPRNVVVVVGSADSLDAADTNRLDRLFQAGLAPLCKELDAAVVYGGTRAGVMQLVGMAMAEFAPGLPLVGVAPKGLVSFGDDAAPEAEVDADPHHTHFVLAPAGPWTSEAEVLIGVAERLAQGKRVVMLVIGGGDGTQRETELACEDRKSVV